MKRTLIKASIFVMLLGLLSGCATTEQIAQIQATADKALATANNASSRADNAMATANSALDAARNAQSTAEAAQSCCTQNSTKLDRMFEKAMQK
ncbi:MAG: Lpp/OprI family alanine-zipper lipoprotein [Gammaproteobacteria bacterium]